MLAPLLTANAVDLWSKHDILSKKFIPEKECNVEELLAFVVVFSFFCCACFFPFIWRMMGAIVAITVLIVIVAFIALVVINSPLRNLIKISL